MLEVYMIEGKCKLHVLSEADSFLNVIDYAMLEDTKYDHK
ncbi:unnamed protein product [Prunus brigantina]